MIDEIMANLKEKMKKTLEVLQEDLSSIKMGKANPNILNKVEVDYYGTMTKVSQLCNISTPEFRVIMLQPWEKNLLKDIEKAILKSDLGLIPNNDGTCIRLIIPEMTEETRKNTVKKVKKIGEDSKVAIRSIRRDSNDKVKALKKDKLMAEDEIKKAENEIQKLVDQFIKNIDDIINKKEKEIMSI